MSAPKAYRGPLAIALATSVTVVSGTSLVYPALPAVASDFQIELAKVGLIMAAFTTPAIFLAPVFGVLADLQGRRRVLIFGLAVFALAGTAAAWAPSFNWLLALRALQGVGMSALSPLTIALISDILPQERELHGQGLKVAVDRIGNIILPIIGGMLAAVSWRAPFAMYALVFLLALAALWRMPETNDTGSHTLKQYLAETLAAVRQPRLMIAFGTGFLRFFLDYGLYIYLPLLVSFRYDAAPVTVGWLIAVSAGGSILTAVSVARIHKWQSAERLLSVAFLASAIALAVIAIELPLWTVGVATFIFGLGNGLISPLQKSLLTRRTPANLRGGVISFDRMIQQIAKSLSPTLMGLLLLVADLEAVFWTLAGLSVIGTLALARASMSAGAGASGGSSR